MSQKHIITQAALDPIKTWEAEIAENLVAHANSTLSKAHGWELIVLPHPFVVDGNDVSVYQDSNGDLVGNYMVRLTFNNINYYAPVNVAYLAGQNPLTNVLSTAGVVQGQGGTAWVTDFSATTQANLIATNTQLLLPHTLLGHWEAHTGGVYSVLPQIVYDSAGHIVSNYVAKIIYKGQQLLLPCHTRLGGPLQPMRLQPGSITAQLGTNFNHVSMGADDNQYASYLYLPPIGGTLPYTFKWQVFSLPGSGTWMDLTPPSGSTPTAAGGSYSMLANTIQFQVSSGSDDSHLMLTCRGAYTNAAGTTYSNWCEFWANDTDGCWVFSGPGGNQNAWYAPIPGSPP